MRRITASSSTTPEAPTFSLTWSGLVAPMIAAETFGFYRVQAIASCAGVSPASAAIAGSWPTRASNPSFR